MPLDLYKKDFDIIPTYTSLVLLIFERLSTFHQQTYRLGGSLFPYRFVVYSLLYDSYTPGHLLDLRSHLIAWADHLLLLR